jgi:hypothetical protein
MKFVYSTELSSLIKIAVAAALFASNGCCSTRIKPAVDDDRIARTLTASDRDAGPMLRELILDSARMIPTCAIPERPWRAAPLPGEAKSSIEDIESLRDLRCKQLSSSYFLIQGWRDAVEVSCLLTLSRYPDGVLRFVKVFEFYDP